MDKTFIGQMDRKIQIVEPISSQSTTGNETTTDTVICEPYACMKDNSGNEDVEGKVIHLINRSYTIWFNAMVKAKGTKLIVIDEEKRFEIVHIKEIGRSHLEIMCKNYE